MRKILLTAYLWWQVAFSACVTLLGVGYALRFLVEMLQDSDGRPVSVLVILFMGLAYVGWRFMFRESVAELRNFKTVNKKGGTNS